MKILALTKMKAAQEVMDEMAQIAPKAEIVQAEDWRSAIEHVRDAEIIITDRKSVV